MFLPIGWPGYAAGSYRRCRAGSTTPTRRFQSSVTARRGAAAAVGEAYRCMHGIVGVGPTVGFPATGRAAHDVEDLLRPAQNERRGLSDDEISTLHERLLDLRAAAEREMQLFYRELKVTSD